MNKTGGLLVLLILTIASLSSSAKEMALGAAMRSRKVSVRANSQSGHSEIRLNIKNITDEELTVDLFGAMFLSRNTSNQRLGVPRIALKEKDTNLTLQAGQGIFLTAPAFCLDKNKSSPSKGQGYRLSPRLVSRATRNVFTHWNKYLEQSQSDIQSAVWDNKIPKAPKIIRPTYDELVLANGLDYVRLSTGVLQLKDPSNPANALKTIAQDVVKILPCSNGIVVVKKSGPNTYAAQTHNGTTWKNLAMLSHIPAHAACLDNGHYLFMADQRILMKHRRAIRIPWKISQFQEGHKNGRRIGLALTTNGYLVDVCMRTGRMKRSIGTYDGMGWGMNYRVLRKGTNLWIQNANGSSKQVVLEGTAPHLMVSGTEVLVRDGNRIWRVQDGRLNFWKDLGKNVRSIALNAAYGTVHVLKKDGKIDVLKLNEDEESGEE